jgi:protein-tyrosine phosphatase
MQHVVKQHGITDFHSHILYGVDDGSPDVETSVEMARLLSFFGYKKVYCTPHLIKGMYDVSHNEIYKKRDILQERLRQENIDIQLLVGREYYLDEFLVDYIVAEPLLFEETNFLMVEIPNNTAVDLVKNTLYTIARRGYTPLIAHPERCQLLEIAVPSSKSSSPWKKWFSRGTTEPSLTEHSNTLLSYLQQLGCKFQANLGSFKGQYGHRVKSNAEVLELYGIYTHVGSDAHSPDAIKSIFSL